MILLGAGASVEAGIPASVTMISEIEELLTKQDEWMRYRDLYNQVKSSIHFSAGLKGKYNDAVAYNIETLVNALYELERNEEHTLYPFIASWNTRFVSLAGERFCHVTDFRKQILRQLKKWMCPEVLSTGDYYQGLARLQKHLNYPLHLFSLNYDLCVERLEEIAFRVETGFDGSGADIIWDWERFEQAGEHTEPAQLYLYKIHGSIDWKRNDGQNLYRVNQIELVDSDKMEVIFGRDFKLEAADPYLFYAYEFRRFTLCAKLIVTIGYSFSDAHINKMLGQGLRASAERKLLVVARYQKEKDCESRRRSLGKLLGIPVDRIEVFKGSARIFLEQPNLGSYLIEKLPVSKDIPF